MCNKFMSVALCAAAVAAPSYAGSGYALSITDAAGEPGEIVQVLVLLDNALDVEGWSFGLEVDSPASITGWAAGADVPNGGGDFNQTDLYSSTGLTNGTVISFVDLFPLSPGAGNEIFSVDILIPISASIGDQFAINFTDTLGSPPVGLVVISEGGAYAPTTDGGLITVVPAPSSLAMLGLGGIVANRRRR
jgi:PEP-CTERM motif-containing protein